MPKPKVNSVENQDKYLVCLDFDGVLFDSIGIVWQVLKHVKGTRQELMNAYRQYRKTREFLPETMADFLAKKGMLDQENKDYFIKFFDQFKGDIRYLVYPDVETFLEQYPKERLAILSRAHPDWQVSKIKNSGLQARVGMVKVVQGDDGKRNQLLNWTQEYQPIFMIDDDPKEVEQLKDLPGVYSSLLNRGKIPNAVGGFKNLTDIAEEIKSQLTNKK